MEWPEIARGQGGVVTRAQLRTDGLSDAAIDRMIATGELAVVTAGVFAVRGAPHTTRHRIWCAVLATRGVVGFETAAALWGFPVPPSHDTHVIVPHRRRVTIPSGSRLHRVFVPRSEIVVLDDLPITSRRWTALDMIGRLRRSDAVRLADRAVQQRWLTASDVERRLRDHPGRTGNAQLREILDLLGDGAAAESERLLHRILRRARIAGWVANHPVRDGGRLLGVVDAAFVGPRVAVEVDGFAFHHDVERFRRDRRRQNALVAAGWTVLRFTWSDLDERPEYVVGLIRSQLTRIGESLPA